MKICIINTHDNLGGAAIAARRLLYALQKYAPQHQTHLLVQEITRPPEKGIEAFAQNYWQKKLALGRFLQERLLFLPYEANKESRFAFSPSLAGADISQHYLVQEADILHLHWTNFGFLSLNNLQKLMQLGKPIVWTLHDMWAFTGGCHHSGNCEAYKATCGQCKFLKKPSDCDLSNRLWTKKNIIYKHKNISVITPSQWLGNRAKESSLFQKFAQKTIPNPLDLSIFKPIDKQEARAFLKLPSNKKLILFAAMKASAKGKGFDYLKKALELLNQENAHFECVILGGDQENLAQNIPFKTHQLGKLHDSESIRNAYVAVDVLVVPSLEENLPNTIMESMACGTPVVGFEVGGIPEMIDHEKTGFLAKYKSEHSLSEGIQWVLSYENQEELSENNRQKALQLYDEKVVAKQVLEVYEGIFQQTDLLH